MKLTSFLLVILTAVGILFSGCLSLPASPPRSSPTPQPEKTSTAISTPTFAPSSTPLPTPGQEEQNINCTQYNPHPMGESIAEKFNASYEDVMGWYCDGYAFEDILLALQTSQLVEESPQNLLSRLDTQSWEEIWEELDLTAQED